MNSYIAADSPCRLIVLLWWKKPFSFSMVALVATYNNINNNKIYLLNITVDGEKVETGSRLKVAWFNWIGRIGRNEQGFLQRSPPFNYPICSPVILRNRKIQYKHMTSCIASTIVDGPFTKRPTATPIGFNKEINQIIHLWVNLRS